MTPFAQCTYKTQVMRLRALGELALKEYPLKSPKLQFINHGENATFKVTSGTNDYLLRIHRDRYHSEKALKEELLWLNKLDQKSSIPVQKPLKTIKGHLHVHINYPGVENGRYCDLLNWQHGRIRYKNLTYKDFFIMGELAAELHNFTQGQKVKSRRYWSPQGLLGPRAQMGSVMALKNVIPNDYPYLENIRKMALEKLTTYERNYPHKAGLIHADLHFGNVVWNKGEVLPIDFDDCGYGFHMYDSAVTLYSSRWVLKDIKKSYYNAIQSYFDGYVRHREVSLKDIEILPWMIIARRLCMLGWLYDRRDNPRLYAHFKKRVKDSIQLIRQEYESGPSLPSRDSYS